MTTEQVFQRREAIRIKSCRGLTMREKFFLIDLTDWLASGRDMTDRQCAWFESLRKRFVSKSQQRIQDTIRGMAFVRAANKYVSDPYRET